MIPEQVARALAAHGLAALEFEPGSTATAPLAAARIGVRVGQIAKSLLFLGKDGRHAMLVCPGDHKVSSSKMKAALGFKTRMANAAETLQATGFEPGGVCPFGIDAGIPILVDQALAQYERIFPAAGTDSSGVPMSFAQLVAITGGRVGDFTVPPGAGPEDTQGSRAA
jgi:prolyl-tRNA editing enzyme YbaK/EbsC (Cys-tRNA(Pro) deacylase)